MGRPEGRPSQAFLVAPGQSTAMPSPMPRVFLWNERFRPSPKESSRTIESVPQADGQDGQDHALALPGGVVGEEPQDQAELGAEVLHASFKAWTGSSSDARRAGK